MNIEIDIDETRLLVNKGREDIIKIVEQELQRWWELEKRQLIQKFLHDVQVLAIRSPGTGITKIRVTDAAIP